MAAVILGGCSEPVPVDDADLDPADRAVCEDLLADLPDELAEEGERELDPADALAAAYGDPPIVVTCVDQVPEGFTEISACEQVDDVGWYVPPEQVADPDGDVVLTALTHRPVVEVSLPGDYRPDGAAAVLTELSGPIADHLELVDECV